MDNIDDILAQFGGPISNDLNQVLKLNEDCDEIDVTFPRSPYIDLHSDTPFVRPRRNTFNVLSVNIQSINAKFNNLLPVLEILKNKGIYFQAIQIQETWQSINDDADLDLMKQIYRIPGYDLYALGKKVCAHGGLFTYVQDEYKCSVRPLYQNSNVYEGLFIDVFSDKLLRKNHSWQYIQASETK